MIKRKTFIQHCTHPDIMKTSIKTALVVGLVLALINHFDSIISGNLGSTQILQIIITFLVPYSVATYGAAKHAQRVATAEHKTHHNS